MARVSRTQHARAERTPGAVSSKASEKNISLT
jgi:hypothetical protein